jgi:hypothetical protein
MPAYATVLQTYATYAERTPSVCQRTPVWYATVWQGNNPSCLSVLAVEVTALE